MYTGHSFRRILRTFLSFLTLVAYVVALPSFATNPHLGFNREEFNEALNNLPKEQHEHVKRQLGDLLGLVTGTLTGAADSAGLGKLDNFVVPGLGDITWPLDVWERFRFIPPEPGAQRGVCVGLNAMANHGIIDRSGVSNFFELLQGAQIMGMSFDAALITVLPPIIFAGDPITLTMSIGGPDSRVGAPLGGLGGLLGQAQGMTYAHNAIEQDSSPTRDDIYDTGDPATMNVGRFIELWGLVPPGGRFDLSVMNYWAAYRFHWSIEHSPNFWYGPVTGIIFRTVVYALIPRLLANQTGRYSDGELTHEVLESFYAITHYPVPFTYNVGCERIPENWYGLASIGSSWTLIQAVTDAFSFCGPYPELCSFGGNINGVNTFAGVRFDDPASGFANLGLLADPDNFLCFVLQFIKFVAPTFTNNLFADLFGMLGTTVASVGCPEIPDLTRGAFTFLEDLRSKYPGAALSGVGW